MGGLIRAFVVVATASWAIYFFLPLTPFASQSEFYWQLESASGTGALPLLLNPIVVWVQAFAWLAAALGMIAFRRWGRSLYLLLTVFYLFSTPFAGILVLSPAAAFMLHLSLVLDGAALALAYLSSAANHYEGDATKLPDGVEPDS